MFLSGWSPRQVVLPVSGEVPALMPHEVADKLSVAAGIRVKVDDRDEDRL